jgi:hypothetical protein
LDTLRAIEGDNDVFEEALAKMKEERPQRAEKKVLLLEPRENVSWLNLNSWRSTIHVGMERFLLCCGYRYRLESASRTTKELSLVGGLCW